MLSAKSIHGYELEVFCHTVRYRFYYSAWWARPKVFTMFEIYSRVSNDAPPSLKKVCQITVCLPTLLSPYVEDGAQTRAAVEAYIDLILYELRNNRSFAVTEKYEQQ